MTHTIDRHLDDEGDRHHRKPKSRRGRNNDKNISVVNAKCHRSYHQLFGNLLPHEITSVLNDVWIDPDFYLVCMPRKRRGNNGRRQRKFCDDCNCVVLSPLKPKKSCGVHPRRRSTD